MSKIPECSEDSSSPPYDYSHEQHILFSFYSFYLNWSFFGASLLTADNICNGENAAMTVSVIQVLIL